MTKYLSLSYILAFAVCILFIISFEKKKPKARDIMPIIIVCATACVGRIIFSFIPQIQPVTAIVIITGYCYGISTGFMTGALCAIISNMFLGQGPWTIWQMLAWGTIGAIAGIIPIIHQKYILLSSLCLYAFLSGFLFSIITDIWTVMSLGGSMNFSSVLGVFITGILFNIGHSIGNVIFILLLFPLFYSRFKRLKEKFGILSKQFRL